jgi:hypothetical protein
MATNERTTLGNFMSLTCFQYLRIGTEDVAERAPIVASGRKRGYDLIEGLGLLGKSQDAALIRTKLDAALGVNGTKLCLVKNVIAKPNGGYEVHITEGACTAGQTSSQPHCAFTLGVFIGAFHAITGMRMEGHETACCACGDAECVYQIDPL